MFRRVSTRRTSWPQRFSANHSQRRTNVVDCNAIGPRFENSPFHPAIILSKNHRCLERRPSVFVARETFQPFKKLSVNYSHEKLIKSPVSGTIEFFRFSAIIFNKTVRGVQYIYISFAPGTLHFLEIPWLTVRTFHLIPSASLGDRFEELKNSNVRRQGL